MRPPQGDGTIDEPVLQLRALLVLLHLVQRRLAHVDIGELGAVCRRRPLVSGVRGDQHGASPSPAGRPPAASGAKGPPVSGRSVFATPATGPARDVDWLPQA